MSTRGYISFEKRTVIALLTLLIVRVAGIFLIPLNETTEARYGEISRKMLELGNWVTLFHDYGVPFLAKPPLFAWLSAASMGVFGVNEFAVRLPSLLLSIGVLALVGHAAFLRHGRDAARVAVLVLASSCGFFVASGTVMTDPSLVFCVTLILVSFWSAIQEKPFPRAGGDPVNKYKAGSLPAQGHDLWPWLFFAGSGFGLLAKGPVALVLAGLPVFFWVLVRKEWRALWQKLPWIRGGLLTLIIALPWYILAEIRTPGFLQYFIVGENIGRFLDPHWHGDKYGFAHAYPLGMIWVFVIAGLFPWILLVPKWLKSAFKNNDGWLAFIGFWMVSSPLFFTFAANIIWPYCLIMQPAFALWLTEAVFRTHWAYKKYVPVLALVTALIGTVAITAFRAAPQLVAEDQKDIIAAWKNTNPPDNGSLIFWSNRMEFSGSFYSNGRARTTEDPEKLKALLHNEIRDCIITYSYNESALPPEVKDSFAEVARLTNKRGTRILLCEP